MTTTNSPETNINDYVINQLTMQKIPFDKFNFTVTHIEKNQRLILKNGDKTPLLILQLDDDSASNIGKIQRIFDELPLTICYHSIHGDEFNLINKTSGHEDSESCMYNGAIKIFGSWIRFYNPLYVHIDQSNL